MQATKTNPATRAIRLPQVCSLIGASRSTVWRWSKDDAMFPKPFRLGAAISAWDEGEVLDWLASKRADRGAK
jgi:predicted DNA-binding transcriptional regulator AlpA